MRQLRQLPLVPIFKHVRYAILALRNSNDLQKKGLHEELWQLGGHYEFFPQTPKLLNPPLVSSMSFFHFFCFLNFSSVLLRVRMVRRLTYHVARGDFDYQLMLQ